MGGVAKAHPRTVLVLFFFAASLLAGCSSLPEAGPSTKAILNGSQPANIPAGDSGYQLVTLTEDEAIALNEADPESAATTEGDFAALPAAAPLGRIGLGDQLRITLWEPNPTGATLLTAPGLDVSLTVDPSGSILMPYVGELQVAGRTPLSVQRTIMAALNAQGHAIQAAVVDSVAASNVAVVEGYAAKPGAYPLSTGASTLLGLVALAGGPQLPDYATTVRITRNEATAKAPLTDIMEDPELDIAIEPGDAIMLLPLRLYFYAFGAVNRPGLFPYDATKLTLTQALADIAGLQDNLAAPRGVFIYRNPDQGTANKKTVYQLDMSKAQAFFIADIFIVRPGDIIYVSDAPVANVAKVLQTISGVSGIAAIPRNFGAGY